MILKINQIPISSNFGVIDAAHAIPHTGIDVPLKEGTPLHAVADGVITRIIDYGNTNIGKGISLTIPDGKQVIYGHLQRFNVHEGDVVHAGQIIAFSGSSGHSTGPHLHLGIIDQGRYIDPAKMLGAAVVKPHAGGVLGLVKTLIEKIDELIYWLNPVHWFQHAWAGLRDLLHNAWLAFPHLFQSGALDVPLIVGTMIGILLLMLGANWPKKWIFWGWILFWTLRGLVFR